MIKSQQRDKGLDVRYRIVISIIVLLGVGMLARQFFTSSLTSTDETAADDNTDQQLLAAFSRGETIDLAELTIPLLPYADNPDPALCGIPTPYGTRNNAAWLNGVYEGDLIQPVVYLYRDHLRDEITAIAPHGTPVEVVLFQANPELDYYMVRIPSAPEGQREGWVPAPLLSFEAPATP